MNFGMVYVDCRVVKTGYRCKAINFGMVYVDCRVVKLTFKCLWAQGEVHFFGEDTVFILGPRRVQKFPK